MPQSTDLVYRSTGQSTGPVLACYVRLFLLPLTSDLCIIFLYFLYLLSPYSSPFTLLSPHCSSAAASMDLGVITFLLRLAWIAGILPILLASVPIKSFDFFHRMLLSFAARGKILQSSDKFTLPQKYFLHFYLVVVGLTTCLTLSTWFYGCREMVPVKTETFQYSTTTIN